MASQAEISVATEQQLMAMFRKEFLRELRRVGGRVRTHVRRVAPKGKTGHLRRSIKVKTGWDRHGPYARITTGARRTSTSKRTGRRTSFRYGLAIQQKRQYLEEGLARVPRR